MSGPPNPPPLYEVEREVMEEVWKRGEVTVRTILEALNASGPKQRAYTTIMTVMAKQLRGKGLLTRRREGKTDVYAPVMSRDAYLTARAAAEVNALVEEYGEVALAQFVERVGELEPAHQDALRGIAGTRRKSGDGR